MNGFGILVALLLIILVLALIATAWNGFNCKNNGNAPNGPVLPSNAMVLTFAILVVIVLVCLAYGEGNMMGYY